MGPFQEREVLLFTHTQFLATGFRNFLRRETQMEDWFCVIGTCGPKKTNTWRLKASVKTLDCSNKAIYINRGPIFTQDKCNNDLHRTVFSPVA